MRPQSYQNQVKIKKHLRKFHRTENYEIILRYKQGMNHE